MKKTVKTVLITLGGLVALALLTHVVVNYVVPFIMHLHGTGMY